MLAVLLMYGVVVVEGGWEELGLSPGRGRATAAAEARGARRTRRDLLADLFGTAGRRETHCVDLRYWVEALEASRKGGWVRSMVARPGRSAA